MTVPPRACLPSAKPYALSRVSYQRRGVVSHGTRSSTHKPLSCSTRPGRSRSPRDIFPDKPGHGPRSDCRVFSERILYQSLFPCWGNENRGVVRSSCVLHIGVGPCARVCVVCVAAALSSVLISSLCKGKCCSASSTLSPSPWGFNVFSVHRHLDDRLFRGRLSST